MLSGYQVYVLAPEDRYSVRLTSEPGLTFIPLYHFRATRLSPVHDWKLYRELGCHYQQINPDLIFHYTIKANIYGTLAAAKAGHVSISVITGLGYAFLNNRWMSSAATFLYRFALKKAAEIWFLNQDDRHYFINRDIVVARKTAILPGEGIDTIKFSSTKNPKTSKAVRFLLIGRLLKEKGIAEYAEAAAILKEKGLPVICRVVGFYDKRNSSAIPRRKLLEWTESGFIHYEGGTDDIIPFIEDADCIVLPSYREGLPVGLLEGASMSRPLIATDTAGCRDLVIPGRNGFLCAPRNAAALAVSMEQFCRLTPESRIKMGRESRALVESGFAIERIKAIYLARISALLEQSPMEKSIAHPAQNIPG